MSSGFLIKGRECPTTRAVPDETIANLTQGSPSHGHGEENTSNGNKIDMTFPLIMIIIQFFILLCGEAMCGGNGLTKILGA